jgi:hypothetical protein
LTKDGIFLLEVKVFDILYLKGKGKPEGTSFVNKPLLERRQVMESGRVFEEVGTRFEICYNVRGQNTQDVRESLQKILEQMYVFLFFLHAWCRNGPLFVDVIMHQGRRLDY